jgi:hypothetical protein
MFINKVLNIQRPIVYGITIVLVLLALLGPRPGPWTAEPNLCVGAERSPVFVS